ncbi:MAG: zinc-binding alcohol dehydrogenase family protein [Deltaproteobacteria bacterium HGW-Deltaproteobacteria-14]|jgi:NADPH2:quinone reductase|nr:MAG: zinc-binding alcohol dehydrogenase family protein [Deltaproteobacteria bacterium HGW-Deltaproteobacteria-14]
MHAVGLTHYLPISDERALQDFDLPQPELRDHDLLVRVHAVSVNPVDTKVRGSQGEVETPPRVLGWDAAGEVVALGPAARGFAVGDRVYYAGDLTRPGSNSELHAVDARIAAKMPQTLDFAAAAALPLTALTAWEALFDRMGVSSEGADAGKTILIVGGAGGVGSIAIQLAKRLARLHVIATASRSETRAWVTGLGADAIIDHRAPLDEALNAVTGRAAVDYVLCLNSTAQHWPAMCRVIAPQGTIASIVELKEPVDLTPLMAKSARFAWELMFTRSMFQTPDMAEQGVILARVAELVDAGVLRGTLTRTLSPISAASMREAHALVEQGRMIGKLVVAGWPEG